MFRFLILLIALTASVAAIGSAWADGAPLFMPMATPNAAADTQPVKATIARQRTAIINPAALVDAIANGPKADRIATALRQSVGDAAASAPLTLDLFGDVSVKLQVDSATSSPTGGVVWQGHVVGDAMSQANLVVNGGDVMGSLIVGNQVYSIRPLGGGVHSIAEINQAKFPPEHGSRSDVPEGDGARTPLPIPTIKPDAATGRTNTTVTIYVVYTPEAKAASYNIIDEIALMVATANQAYVRSGVNVTLTLVGTAQVTGYDDTSLSSQLDQVTSDTTVAQYRNTAQADLVSIISETATDACGYAWLGPNSPTYAFSAVRRDCAIDNLSFPHEVGHNFGANHDRYVSGGSSASGYAYGYVDTTNRVRTIMAYNNACSESGFNCTRLGYFSSPSLSYNGRALGIANGQTNAAYNVLTHNTNAASLASYRTGVSPTYFYPQTGWWYNSAQGGRGYAMEVNPSTNGMYIGAFLYDNSGASIWYVASCTLTNSVCSGTLQQYRNGSTLTSSNASNVASAGSVGSISLTFSDASNATMTWPGGTLALTRYIFSGAASLSPGSNGVPQNGWYYNTSEGGTGWFVESQLGSSNSMFLAGYMYNSSGQATWYISSGTMSSSTSYTGTLYEYTGGMPMTASTYTAPTGISRGSVSIAFSSTTTARVTLPSRSLTLTRYTQF